MPLHTSHVEACQTISKDLQKVVFSLQCFAKQFEKNHEIKHNQTRLKNSVTCFCIASECQCQVYYSLLYQVSSLVLLVVNGYLRVKRYLFTLFTGGFLRRKEILCMVWAPKLDLEKKIYRQCFLVICYHLIRSS